jgi:hypothetical protein
LGRKCVGLGIGQLGPGFGNGDLIVARIQFDQNGAGFDLLIVDDRRPQDGAANASGDGCDMCVDLSIIC